MPKQQKHKISYVSTKDNPKQRTLFCHECGSGTFRVLHTKMARQVKSQTAHHMRLVAVCTGCKKEKRIGWRG